MSELAGITRQEWTELYSSIKVIKEQVSSLNKILRDNGQPGLCSQVESLKADAMHHQRQDEVKWKSWNVRLTLISALIGIGGMLIGILL